MAKKVVGAQLWTVRDFLKTPREIAQSFEKIAKIGYSAIQLSAIGEASAAQVAAMAKDAGLIIAGTHMGWEEFVGDTDRVIADHKIWNCTHSAIGSLPQEYYSAEGLKRFLKELKPVAKKLAAAGIDFSFHNHNIEFIRLGRKLMLEMLYEQSSPDVLKAEIDTYWVQAGGQDPETWVRKVAGRIPMLHLKDYAMAPGEWSPRFAEVGEGNLDWAGILKAAKAAKVEWYLVEQDNCYGRDPFESLKISYRNLKKMGLR